MGIIKGKFRFNKAGQGCFYTGRIHAGRNKNYFFAFDCGTKSSSNYITEEIESFKADLSFHNRNILDMLVISHFDADHVSQVAQLLNGLSECRRAVLPYLSPFNRLLLYHAQDEELTDDYRGFITDPAGYLLERGVNEIIYIDGNADAGDQQAPSNPPPPGDIRDGNISSIVSLKPIAARQFKTEQIRLLRDARIKFYYSNDKIYVGSFWEFYFYTQPQPDRILQVSNFLAALSAEFKIAINENIDKEILIKLLETQRSRTKTKDIYKKIFGNTNITGLIMLHGPVQFVNANMSFKRRRRFAGPYHFSGHKYNWHKEDYCGSLLNGDISLTPHLPYSTYINQRMGNIVVYQVPHHGSRRSWSNNIINTLNNVDGHTVMVINYGWGNSHGHPGEQVMADIKGSYLLLRRNTQLKSFTYSIETRT